MNIKIIKDCKSLKKSENIKWEEVPKLAIITGINGGGKTHLLECVSRDIQDREVISNVDYMVSI